MKEGFDLHKVAEQIGLLFAAAWWCGTTIASRPDLVTAGCALYLTLTVISDRIRRA